MVLDKPIRFAYLYYLNSEIADNIRKNLCTASSLTDLFVNVDIRDILAFITETYSSHCL